MVGERLATVPGGLSAAARLADATGARLAWVPRRAGERGALEAGALPDAAARWPPGGRRRRPRSRSARRGTSPNCLRRRGRDADGISGRPPPTGRLARWLVGGIEPDDFADPDAVLAALDAAGFVVSLELRHSAVTERADVVFPVAPTTQKSGAFVNWEGRYRRSNPHCTAAPSKPASPITRCSTRWPTKWVSIWVLSSVEAAREELAALGAWDGKRAPGPQIAAPRAAPTRRSGEAVLTGWRMLLDNGRLQDGEPHLAGTARKPVVRLSADTAAEIGAADGDAVTVSTAARLNHPAADHHRHARPGGVASAELAGFGGASATGRDPGQHRARSE